MLRCRVFVIVVLCVIANWTAAQSPGQRVNPGLWAMTLLNEIPAGGKPTKWTICIVPEQAAEMSVVPKASSYPGCQITKGPAGGAVIDYSLLCGTSVMQVRTTITGDQYETISTWKQETADRRQIMTGRRLGACPTPAAEQ